MAGARLLPTANDELRLEVQWMGRTSYRSELKLDAVFWTLCQNQ